MGMMSCYAVRKPLLNNNHKSENQHFCCDKKDWGIEEWRKVVFSDESRFKLFSYYRVRARRTSMEKFLPACVASAIQQWRELCMWGCITSEDPGMLHSAEGTMNSEKYIETMEEVMFPSVYGLLGDNFIFQQENASCDAEGR